jgi:hypothetical protein
MSDSESDEKPCCDWCDKQTKMRSIVMRYTGGVGAPYFKWDQGDAICRKCSNGLKPELYLFKYCGRRFFATEEYYDKYWKSDPRAKIMDPPPQDHQPKK